MIDCGNEMILHILILVLVNINVNILVPYHVDRSKKLTYVSGSSYTWFIFNLNTKQCYSQITHMRYKCTDVCIQQ
jgi:hypothetical protein